MAGQRVIREGAQRVFISSGRSPLKRAHADVAGRNPRQHGAGQRLLAVDGVACCHHGQTASGCNSQGVHRLADDVFPQHRPEGSASVAATRKRCCPGPFELNVKPLAAGGDLLAEQDGSSIAKRCEMTILMPRVGLRNRL